MCFPFLYDKKIQREMRQKMARKKKNEPQKIEYTDFVWCIDNLSGDQLLVFDAWVVEGHDYLSLVNVMVEDGFQVSVKNDYYNNCKLASAINNFTGFDNSGLCVSARSDDSEEALAILLFKYHVLADRDLRGFAEKKPRGIRG